MNDFSRDSYQEQIFNAAIDYARRRWHIFPLHSIDKNGICTCGNPECTDAGKHPRVARGLKEATRDINKLEKWFGPEAPLSNIAVATGEISGITVIDIDVGEGKGGAESWADIVQQYGEPDTLMSQTGSGGNHVIFKYNSSLKTASNVLGKGIDCRNDGGYIVAPPSRHRSGNSYEWLNEGKELANLPKHMSQRKETRGRPKKDDVYKNKYNIEQVGEMLDAVPPDDRDLWRSVGIILGREFKRADEAWSLYVSWSDKWGGTKGRNHDQIMREAFYELSQIESENQLTVGTIVKAALDNGWAPKTGDVPVDQFVYYAPGNNYIYRHTASFWIASAVDKAVSPINQNGKIIKASEWLAQHKLATSMTSDPAIESDYMQGFDYVGGEVIASQGGAVFNSYRRPTIELGDAKLAAPFLAHLNKVFNKQGDVDQFLNYMAHRVQKPWEKPRFALLIAGDQGVGKDTAIDMCIPAIGAWNLANIEPAELERNFNEYLAATLVRISEAANLADISRWIFNERTKVLISGTPDICVINPKYGHKYTIKMHCGVVITTNHLATGIYIPEDDRRYDVIEAATLQEMDLQDEVKKREYFTDLWDWFNSGGANHIAAFLHERDIRNFSASSGQRKTKAHESVVKAGLEQNGWFYDILEQLGNPKFISCPMIRSMAAQNGDIDTSKQGAFNTRLKAAVKNTGYFKYNNPNSRDGRWYKAGIKKGFIVYALSGVPAGLDPRSEVSGEGELF